MLLLPGAFKIWKLIVCTQVPHQHGYVAEPMSQEEHDQIAQYLTICEWRIVVDQKFWTKYFWEKKYIFLSNWRGQAERLVDRRHWPSSWGLLLRDFDSRLLVWIIVCRDIFDNIQGYLVVDVWGTVVFWKLGRGWVKTFLASQNVKQKKFFYANCSSSFEMLK